MQSLEDYLNMSDWQPNIWMKTNSLDNFHWVQYNGWADPFRVLNPEKKPFWLVMTLFDGNTPAYLLPEGRGTLSADDKIWEVIDDDYIISPPLYEIPAFEIFADMAFVCIDQKFEYETISDALRGFKNFDQLSESEEFKDFWQTMKKLNVLFYDSNISNNLFLARDKTTFLQFMESDEIKKAPQRQREYHQKARQKEWEDLGPEIGPGKCLEPNCNRLTIESYTRCFMHQKEFWNSLHPRNS